MMKFDVRGKNCGIPDQPPICCHVLWLTGDRVSQVHLGHALVMCIGPNKLEILGVTIPWYTLPRQPLMSLLTFYRDNTAYNTVPLTGQVVDQLSGRWPTARDGRPRRLWDRFLTVAAYQTEPSRDLRERSCGFPKRFPASSIPAQ